MRFNQVRHFLFNIPLTYMSSVIIFLSNIVFSKNSWFWIGKQSLLFSFLAHRFNSFRGTLCNRYGQIRKYVITNLSCMNCFYSHVFRHSTKMQRIDLQKKNPISKTIWFWIIKIQLIKFVCSSKRVLQT